MTPTWARTLQPGEPPFRSGSDTFRFRKRRREESAMRATGILAVAVGLLAAAPAASAASDLTLNEALGGNVEPAAAAALIDGDGSTTWCANGPAVVDLKRPTALTGAGLTMKDASNVQLETSTDRRHWDTVTPRDFSAPAGGPAYIRFKDLARYARLTVADGACVGELR